ncbi:MAG: hypothetical protein ACYC2T_00930 [Bacillota bacterium]
MPGLKQPPLEFPLVQYITLKGAVLFQETDNPMALALNKPMITIHNRAEDLARTLQMYGVAPEALESINFQEDLVMVFVNVRIDDMKYRTIKITALGTLAPGLLLVVKVPRRYFYRDAVYFELYDANNRIVKINRETFPVRLRLLNRNT